MMKIWSISDLHLAFSDKSKEMGLKFEKWKNHTNRVKENWKEKISYEDLVLISGDISWAMRLEDAMVDLQWIDHLPGNKIFVKGNHDFWWSSASKVRKILPQSIRIISNDSITVGEFTIGGTRLWDLPTEESSLESKKIFNRELNRLELSLSTLDKSSSTRIAMTHYPPLEEDLIATEATKTLESFKIDMVIFGHRHDATKSYFGKLNGIEYHCTAADIIDFDPKLIYS